MDGAVSSHYWVNHSLGIPIPLEGASEVLQFFLLLTRLTDAKSTVFQGFHYPCECPGVVV